jgi:predicted NAD/FAD-binding protein
MERLAVVGTGVAGLGCAHTLRGCVDLRLFEKQGRAGGHTNTLEVVEGERRLPVDTGFIVFNKVTYPNLCRLFEELGIEAQPSEMSFSVQHLPSGLEYNGMGINKLFAQRSNLLRPRFHRLVASILRFFRAAHAELDAPGELSLREFAARHRLGSDFLDFYLVPMSSSVWSTEPRDVLEFPARTLLQFFHNHGFLGVSTHHPWFTVKGGARTYVARILDRVGQPVVGAEVVGIRRGGTSVRVDFADGRQEMFDRVVLACHADEALRMLGDADDLERDLLAPFRYQRNEATLHTWAGLMPRRRLAWASWNHRVGKDGRATTHYWMNALQRVSEHKDYFVSLNSRDAIPAEHVLHEAVYEHPVFTLDAIRAQARLHELNARGRDQRVFFCGSYFKYGFHEDAYSSGLYLGGLLRERYEGGRR